MDKKDIAKKYFLKGYYYAVEILENMRNKDILVDFFNDYMEVEFIEEDKE